MKKIIPFLLLSVACFGAEYNTIVITQGEWVDNVGNHFYFDLSQVDFSFEYQLPEEPGEHVCEFPDRECTCIYAGVTVTDEDVPEELKPPAPEEFLNIENWIDTSKLQKNRRGNYVVPWVSQDGTKSGEILLNTIDSLPVWKDQVVSKYIDIKDVVDEYAKKWIAQYSCPYDNPNHQGVTVLAGTLEDGCVFCTHCRTYLYHKQDSNSCKCLCTYKTSHKPNPSTCRCFCGAEHYPDTSGCPGVCAVCLEAVSGVKSDPNKHAPKDDGCGCKCGYYNANNPSANEEFHMAQEEGEDVETCICQCGHWHDYTSSECENVCGTCKHRTRSHTPTEATDEDHTPNAASAHKCGCKCGEYTAGGTDNPRFHIQKANSCICYGSDGNGGSFHFPCARGDCKKICQYKFNGVSHLANLGTEAVKSDALTLAAPSDHTPDTGAYRCGCKCQEYNNNSQASDLTGMHNHKDGTCACWCTKYAATAQDDDIWHNWQTGACICDCTLKHHFTGGSTCPGICAVCKARNASSPISAECLAAQVDHTPKSSACGCNCGQVTSAAGDIAFHNGQGSPGCRCSCGKFHKYFDGSSTQCLVCATCKLTEDGREPSDETLHKLDSNCECFCGYFGPNAHTAQSEALHAWDQSDVDTNGIANCVCKCGVKHKFRLPNTTMVNDDIVCPGICAYCKSVLTSGAPASEDDHEPKSSSKQRCGCKCGKLDHSAGANKFHIQKPGTCQCYGANGNGGLHHFRHPKSGCTRLCAYAIGGKYHLVASKDHDLLDTTEALPTDHTKTDTIGYCGCKCGDFTGSEANCPTSFHNQDPNDCGCYCTHSSKAGHHRRASNSCWCYCGTEMLGHVFPEGECRCYCYGTAHHSSYKHNKVQRQDGKCPGVCHGPCGEASDPTYKDEHEPKSNACGCECGAFSGANYTDRMFHNGHKGYGTQYCLCACGRYHKQSDNRTDCTQICKYCGDGKTNLAFVDPITPALSSEHTWTVDSCYCKCGKFVSHKYADTNCVCFCGEIERSHIWRQKTKTFTEQYECQSCGETISVYHIVWECARCGKVFDGSDVEETHDPTCDDRPEDEDGYPGGYCEKHYIYYADECPECKNEENGGTGGGGGNGGSTGGTGGYRDI